MAEEGAQALVAKTVANSVQEVRRERKWTQQRLAEEMTAKGWPTDRTTVVRLEQGKRGISVDDLVALAAALNVSPGWLLLPPKAGDEEVAILGNVKVPAWAAWQWVDGLYPLPTSDEDGYNSHSEMEDFRRGRPPEMRETEQHPAAIAARDLAERVQRALADPSKTNRVSSARTAVARVVAELDEMEALTPANHRRS